MNLNKGDWPSEILLVEDNPADVFLVQRSVLKQDLNINLHVAENGAEALKFLTKQYPFEKAPTPELILLDLNLPVMDGRQLMEKMVASPILSVLPVVVLTTSENEADVLNMYRLRCSAYFVKPVDLPNFSSLMQDIWAYWRAAQLLPPRGGDEFDTSESTRIPARPRRVWIS